MQKFDTLLTGPRVLRVEIKTTNDVQAHKMAYHLQLAYGYREYFLKEGERVETKKQIMEQGPAMLLGCGGDAPFN